MSDARPLRYTWWERHAGPFRRSPHVIWRVAGRVVIGANTRYHAFGDPLKIEVSSSGTLIIGADCSINHGLDLYCCREVRIGDCCRIAPHVYITDHGGHPVRPGEAARKAPVTLGRNVWIGHSARVLPGVTIGNHSVVAAASVVTRDVPPCSVVAGAPARVISRFEVRDDLWVRP